MAQILVIDDDVTICDSIAEILELEGYSTFTANSGAVGVQIAHDKLPDLILCDVMMPGLDGYAVLQTLQNDPATAQIPIILVTAKSDVGDVQRVTELRAAGYLAKPFLPAALLSAIHEELQA